MTRRPVAVRLISPLSGLGAGSRPAGGEPMVSLSRNLPERACELGLLLGLVFLLSLVRIYYGGSQGLMVVWKGEPTFQDTLVDVSKMIEMPPNELSEKHRSVLYQLEAMDIIDPQIEVENIRKRAARSAAKAKGAVPISTSKEQEEGDKSKASN